MKSPYQKEGKFIGRKSAGQARRKNALLQKCWKKLEPVQKEIFYSVGLRQGTGQLVARVKSNSQELNQDPTWSGRLSRTGLPRRQFLTILGMDSLSAVSGLLPGAGVYHDRFYRWSNRSG